MDLQMIGALFTLFSGESDVGAHLPLLKLAAAEVRRGLREGADETDVRLCYLAAALANVRYGQMTGAQERTATYAGTVGMQTDGQIGFAEKLAASYRGLCADLLRDETFFFFGTGDGDDGIA